MTSLCTFDPYDRGVILPYTGIAIVLLLLLQLGALCTKMPNRMRHSTAISNLEVFNTLDLSASRLRKIVVFSNTSSVKSSHPVIELVAKRWKTKSKPGKRLSGDAQKVALCIEGGGMRGCVAAGATAAINFLGLSDSIDVIYGSSAGAMVGTYFISRQFSGIEIYQGRCIGI